MPPERARIVYNFVTERVHFEVIEKYGYPQDWNKNGEYSLCIILQNSQHGRDYLRK